MRNQDFFTIMAGEEYSGRVVVPTPTTSFPSQQKTVLRPMETIARRLEERVSLNIRVDLRSLDVRKRSREAVTENVSAHGARVLSSRPLKPSERLNVHSLPGDLRARARVVYCEQIGADSFAIGLQLLASFGDWK